MQEDTQHIPLVPLSPSQHTTSVKKKESDYVDAGRIALLPILNVIITVVLTAVLIYVYMSADNKPFHYTMAGMPIPALVALIVTLIKMCLAGGIGYAVSEYKWIQLERGSRLSLLDVYDACARGFGGMIRVMTGIRPDMILVPTILLQLGLIAMGPASQQILTTAPTSYCDHRAKLRFTDLTKEVLASWGTNDHSIQTLLGTTTNYLFEMALDGVGNDWVIPLTISCPVTAVNCTVENVLMFHNTLECTEGSMNQTLVVSEQDLSVKTVQDYYNATADVYATPPKVPQILYGGAMAHRTYYDFTNYTTNATAATNRTMFAGDQVIVLVSNNGKVDTSTGDDTLVVQECKLVTYLNRTTLNVMGRHRKLDFLESTPIRMDYDLLSDSTHWGGNFSDDDHLMLNAYAVQVAALRFLIDIDRDMFRYRDALTWQAMNRDRDSVANLVHDYLIRLNRILVIGRPEGMTPADGIACYDLGITYRLEPAAYYSLSLALLVPLFWWVFTWVSALYRAGGVSRGNSQVILLVTGFTAALRRKFKGLSHADSNAIFNKAKQINVAFGELKTDQDRRGHTSFGLPDQVSPARRKISVE
ncbi:hypothetical protein BJV82DRAFT_638402 [Fennellomyces sp. T-0311]|nr:hypothetical protein BJV82DRAFT_638402 [Fennellomyces sp. T-0311]